MALTLSQSAIRAMNDIDSGIVWLILLEINMPNDPDVIRLVRNNEDISWKNELWQAFPFTIGESKQDDTGSISSLEIVVDNTTRDLEYYLAKGAGGAGCEVVLRCVRSDSLDGEADFEEYYTVKSTSVNAQSVTFTLGNAYPSKSRRPWGRYLKNTCHFKYKGVQCGCVSKAPTCNHTLKDCRERGNSVRFGGFSGIPEGGLYV